MTFDCDDCVLSISITFQALLWWPMKEIQIPVVPMRLLMWVLGVMAADVLLQSCAPQSTMQVVSPISAHDAESGAPLAIRLDACIDRTNTQGRDLAADATALISEGLRGTHGVALRADAPLVLHCEVTQFVAGSAFKRWLAPGWGATAAQVAIMLTNAKDQSTVAIVQGNSVVAAGGLYTIGASDYILKSAVDDAVSKLRAWVANPTASPG